MKEALADSGGVSDGQSLRVPGILLEVWEVSQGPVWGGGAHAGPLIQRVYLWVAGSEGERL